MKHWTYLLVLFLLGATGCEVYFEPKLINSEPKLAMYCYYNPEQQWQVKISPVFRLYDFTDYDIERAKKHPINDAVVELYADGVLLERLPNTADFTYTSSSKPKPGVRYKLRVAATGYPAVEAESEIPDTENLIQNVAYQEIRKGRGEYSFTLTDKPNVRNYYGLVLYKDEGNLEDYLFYYAGTDPVMSATSLDEALAGERFSTKNTFSDELFDGKGHTFRLSFDSSPTRRVFGYLTVISEEAYRFEETNRLMEKETIFPFGEPLRPYSNVQNGYGILAGYIRYQLPDALVTPNSGTAR